MLLGVGQWQINLFYGKYGVAVHILFKIFEWCADMSGLSFADKAQCLSFFLSPEPKLYLETLSPDI